MEYLLGIDIGTSACKIALFDRNGTVSASDTEEYHVYYPHPGWAEQDPEEWWDAVCRGTRRCVESSGVSPADIVGVGIDGQSWSAIPVSGDGTVLCRTPIWMDNRSADICARLNAMHGADTFLRLSGNPLTASYTTGKILWFRDTLPEVYRKTDKFLQSNSFIAYKMTGQMTQDHSQGYGLHCFDIRKNAWDRDAAYRLGIPSDLLPELHPCHDVIGHITAEAAKLCGLSEGTPVVAGGLDSAAAALGAGVIHTGETQEQGGQSEGMSICADSCCPDKRLILCSHVIPGKWLVQGGTTGGGGVMRWIQREFTAYETEIAHLSSAEVLKLLDEAAAAVAPGSDGLVFLPYMSGERTPIWDPKAKGVFFGMDFSKTKAHFIRAAMEGVAFSLRHNLETAGSIGAAVSSMRATGGCANSRFWTQLKADITGKVIEVPASDNAANLGAALLAGVGTGLYRDFEDAVSQTVRILRTHTPGEGQTQKYGKNYSVYLALYENLRSTMADC